jgi:hypothetical protein
MESFVRTCGYRGRPQGTRCKRTPPRRRPSAPGSTRAGVTRVSQGRLSHTRALSRGVMSPLKRSWRSHHAQQPDERGLERLEDRGLPRSRVTETLHCVTFAPAAESRFTACAPASNPNEFFQRGIKRAGAGRNLPFDGVEQGCDGRATLRRRERRALLCPVLLRPLRRVPGKAAR